MEKIVPAFTSNVARLLRLHDRGRLAVGKVADLLVLDDENGVRDVMAAGRWHVREHRQLIRGQYEQPVDEAAG